MDLRKQFERELYFENIPCKELADKETLEIWFDQFCKAPTKPSYWLYRLQYYSDDEVDKIISKKYEGIPEIKHNHNSSVTPMAHFFQEPPEMQKLNKTLKDYKEKERNKTLEDKFYIKDIKQTEIAKALYTIHEKREKCIDTVFLDNSNIMYNEIDRLANDITSQLDVIPSSLASAIIERIKEKDMTSIAKIIEHGTRGGLNNMQQVMEDRIEDILAKKLIEWKENSSGKTNNENEQHTIDGKKIPAKYYALLHWIKIELGKEIPFERNVNDKLPKRKIIEFAKNKYGKNFSAVEFYNQFQSIDITKKVFIAKTFGKGFKEKLTKISGNDADIIHYLKDFPN